VRKKSLIGDDVFVVEGFMEPAECGALIRASEERGYEAATLPMGATEVLLKAFRDNDRLIVDDPTLAGRLFQRLKGTLPRLAGGRRATGLNERFRYYRYGPGQTFAPHHDFPFERSAAAASALTLMVYLNDDFAGGSTDFYHEDQTLRLSVRPARGMALIFRHEILHAGTRVESGRKYVLRTDVMYATERWSL
jgi:prolyl 4-hydroxylase